MDENDIDVAEEQTSNTPSLDIGEDWRTNDAKRIRRDKTICIFFIVCLITLSTIAMGFLYFSSKEYLIWLSDREKAKNEIQAITERGEQERVKQQEYTDALKETISGEFDELNNRKAGLKQELLDLEKSKRNLIQDIGTREAELKSTEDAQKQLVSLKQEAQNLRSLAEKYQADINALSANLANLNAQKDLLASQIPELSKELDLLKKDVAARKLFLSESDAIAEGIQVDKLQLSNLQQQNSDLSLKISNLVTERLKASDETSVILQKRSTAALELQSLQLQANELKTTLTTLKSEISTLNTQKSSAATELDSLKKEIQQLANQKISLTTNVGSLNHDVATLNAQKETSSAELNTLKSEISMLNTKKNGLLTKNNQLQEQISTTAAQTQKATEELSAAQKKRDTLSNAISKLQLEHQKLVDSIASLKSQETSLSAQGNSANQ